MREQTAELSSSLLAESDISRRFGPHVTAAHTTSSNAGSRPPRTIEESPDSVDTSSELSRAVRVRTAPSALSSEVPGAAPVCISPALADAPGILLDDEDEVNPVESTPLLPRERLSSHRNPPIVPEPLAKGPSRESASPLPTKSPSSAGRHSSSVDKLRILLQPKSWDARHVARKAIVEPVGLLPAVFLGVLLNLLDALSYGIILFPLGEAPFAGLGPDGVSMFYVSCIVAQLTYSTGSVFRGGVGSEMIEVVPFFHKMAYIILGEMGTGNPEALRATCIVSYAMSSVVTGIAFFMLGAARLGTLVNFFPHSILTGCIGGVGIFLVITGVEVSARLEGNLEFTLEVARRLVALDTIVLWVLPLVLAIVLLTVKHFFNRPWLVPAYFIAITAVFYVVAASVPSITMDGLRSAGWVFAAPETGVPFYNFYTHYKWHLVDWKAVWLTVPSQLALTFFGVLHVPINVPNLAMVVREDTVDINRELSLHGLSNFLSGVCGSVQNYLVFSNSALLIESGGNNRLAGFLLAAATFLLWIAGPALIAYVPVMVVGTLIFMLGIDLAREALVGTWGRLHRLEYWTIVAIAVVMGTFDFVIGVAMGIALACVVYVVQTSHKAVIRSEFSGTVAESTVRRHPRHRDYLHQVGSQIRIVKLGGFLFFGSIVKVEQTVRALIDAERFAATPIRYTVVDCSYITGIDFSASEAFVRMNRILHRRGVKLVMSGVTLASEVGRSLSMVGLFVGSDEDAVPVPEIYEDLNGALEACENELLVVLNDRQQQSASKRDVSPPQPVPDKGSKTAAEDRRFDNTVGSPRNHLLHQAAITTISQTRTHEMTPSQGRPQPLPLIMSAFVGITARDADFWARATEYFHPRSFAQGQQLYAKGDPPDGFYLLQSGILRAEYFLEQGTTYHESIVAGTTCGELPFFSETQRTCAVVAERAGVAWRLTAPRWRDLQARDPEVAIELLKVGLKLSAERTNAITSYVLITAS